jgi:predicted Zn-dependent protease
MIYVIMTQTPEKMSRSVLLKTFILLFFISVMGCRTVPLTGRKQLSLMPSSQVQSMSYSQYDEVLRTSKVITGTEQSKMIERVGNRIKEAVETYLTEHHSSKLLEGYEWEFSLIESEAVNAWCMPGGKVAFYTGILPVCQDEEGVAVVMGHEVAHAIARHGSERMSQGMVTQLGGVALAVALEDKPVETQALFLGAYGVGSQVGVLLPFSRMHESEADQMGLTFMAMAGYDPRKAPEFWTRMSSMSSGGQPPEFMSTHPSHSTRIDNLNEWMPDAMLHYNAAKKD